MGPSGTTRPHISRRVSGAIVHIWWSIFLAGWRPSVGHTRPTSHLLHPLWLPAVAVELPFPPHGGPMSSAPATAAMHISFAASVGECHDPYTPEGGCGRTTSPTTSDGSRVWPPHLRGHRGEPRTAPR